MVWWTRFSRLVLAGAVISGAIGLPQARADEALFGYLSTTDSLPKARRDFQLANTYRHGKAKGDYTGLDVRLGLGTGVTDKFQTILYLNTSYLHTQDTYDPANTMKNLKDGSSYNVNGVSLEMKYRFLSPYKDLFGLSFIFEPDMAVRDPERGVYQTSGALNFRAIGQKNFLDDQLALAANILTTPKWMEYSGGPDQKILLTEGGLGASYRIVSNWFVGAELRNRREFTGQSLGNQAWSAFYLGPNVHYGAKKWWATLTIMPQISGRPLYLGQDINNQAVQDSSRYLGRQEKIEIRLKIGINISEFL